MNEISDDLNTLYKYVVASVYTQPDFVSSPRGMLTKEVLGATLTLRNPRARLITSPTRAVNYSFAVGEFIWYWDGRNDLEFISRYNKRLPQFSDDGVTLNSAYGYRIFGPFGHSGGDRNQWKTVLDILRTDRDSRRAVIHILNRADISGISKDVPCTSTLQFFIRDERLHMHVYMRSNDVFWGLPYDVFSFTLMQEAMAIELGVGLGHYKHTAGSLHIYERHFSDSEKIISELPVPSPSMPPITYTPDGVFGDVSDLDRIGWCEEALSNPKLSEIWTPASGSCEEWMVNKLLEKWRGDVTK